MESRRIPNRAEVPERDTWNLADLFESDEDWSRENEALKTMQERLQEYKGTLGESAEALLSFLRLEDQVSERLGRLYVYASCKSDQDTANSEYQDMRGKALAAVVAISGAAAFAAPEIMAIPEDRLSLFRVAQPGLEEYERSIYKIRRMAEHILSPEEEALLAAAGEMASSPDNINSILRDADMRYDDAVDSSGQPHPLTDGTFVPMLMGEDRQLRRSAYENYYARLRQFRNTAAATLDAEFKQRRFFSEARRYDSLLAAALHETEVPVEVYTGLIEAVHANMDKMYDYVALRKRLLGLEKLRMYDVYAPIVSDCDESISFQQAKEQVLEALAVLGEDYTALLREGFENRWIDVYENEGKRGGAYSNGSGIPHPYVLLNHKDNLDSMFTLAHEMGHALHSYYSSHAQPVSQREYVIFVAEVASTCNEVLLMLHLLDKTGDKKRRAYLINHFLDQFKGTVFRQTMFAEFELEMGRMAQQGQTLTADLLCREYRRLNSLYFGQDMVTEEGSEGIAMEWARIPHFFYNYYVFQYATGFCAAVAIARRIRSEGESAVEDYKRFLSGGGSADPVTLLKTAGVDMSSTAPVSSALQLFGELVKELEELV